MGEGVRCEEGMRVVGGLGLGWRVRWKASRMRRQRRAC